MDLQRRLEKLIYKEMRLMMMNGGRYMNTIEPSAEIASNEVDQIRYWDYNPDAKHYKTRDQFINNIDLGSDSQQRDIPEIANYTLDRKSNKNLTKKFYRAVFYDPTEKHGLFGHNLTDTDVTEWLMAKGVLSTQFELNQDKKITDIVDHQFGNASSFISCTTSIRTAIRFLSYRLSTKKNEGGAILTIETNRGIEISNEPQKYSRKFVDREPYLNLHNKASGYDEWVIPAKIKPNEIVRVTPVDTFIIPSDNPRRIRFGLKVIDNGYVDNDVETIINSEFTDLGYNIK